MRQDSSKVGLPLGDALPSTARQDFQRVQYYNVFSTLNLLNTSACSAMDCQTIDTLMNPRPALHRAVTTASVRIVRYIKLPHMPRSLPRHLSLCVMAARQLATCACVLARTLSR